MTSDKGVKREGSLFVISAPSGAGKTTLCKRLLNKMSDLKLSVSYTTRAPREGEVNDVDYTFIDKNMFLEMIDKGEFAEWATVHGNLYGTSIKRLKQLNAEGYDIILDIDIQGAMQLKKNCDDAVYIFVLPPSMDILQQRLVNRKTDSEEVITRRLDNAKAEIENYNKYDYLVINDNLDEAFRELESIIIGARLKTDKINPEWIKKTYEI